ncbi:hypothetical protein [Paenibacillus sp. IHBB 10380]|uniref:hypothetical protein n=1 Tax=Paenibacillus sp. IHBB 10380 TaxID=1566358 RepID=UPI0005CFC5B2|nr:hypothetical protein [Paenibacillus sp. IHBB 10380]AJS59311.1 hypothetical protein UB51_13475 [Paenibacillus sp. IHBB 10380]
MTDLKLAQNFSMIALNAQRSLEMTNVKKVALRCMAAAVILEVYLDSGFTQAKNTLVLKKDVLNQSHTMLYQETILKPLVHKNVGVMGDLNWWLKRASMLSKRKLIKFEHAVSDSLKEMGLLEEIPHLLGCDLYFHSAGVEIKEYRSHIQEYTRITENIRAEILEDGPVTDETICMLWLLRESGCMHDFFSRNELEKVSARMYKLYQSTPLAKAVYPIRIHHGIELAIKQFLRMKKAAVKTPVGSGLNFLFPILERSQSVFIDTEAMLSNSTKRLHDVRMRLESNGHAVKVLGEGQTIKIDNIVYEAIPHAIYGRVPIHGVRLLPRLPI